MESLLIKNYKCFDDTGAVIKFFKDINIIIGKNNSGKSSIIDVIKFLTTKDKSFFKSTRDHKPPNLIFEYKITADLIQQSFPIHISGGGIGDYKNYQEYGMSFVNDIIEFEITETSHNFLKIKGKSNIASSVDQYFSSYVRMMPTIFGDKNFLHLTAERDIQPEIANHDIEILSNGTGATNFVQQIINKSNLDSSLIEEELLGELNKITNPDINFSRMVVQLNDNHCWEIYFENNMDGRIPLSKMGSGVKTILLVLLLILIKPKIDKKPISSYIFALEELENNLHPSQQRRLYFYLYEFAKKNNCKFFFTTHSNIVIDLYNKLENTQIFHINRNEDKTTIRSINQYSELNQILDDLDIKASDILQSNSIIWVEGPSDRTYLNNWIKLIDPNLIEGYHYSIMFYGGRLLANLSLDYDNLQEELIPLIKLNRNCYVVMDRDGKIINAKLNETKTRITNELGEDRVWITKGREIENYITNKTLNEWLKTKYNVKVTLENYTNEKFETILENEPLTKKIKYNLNKNKFANEIVDFIDATDLNILDLNPKIEHIISLIKQWNKE